MMRNRIFYITYFDSFEKKNARHVSPAAVTKSEYIVKKLTEIGYEVQIISPALPNRKGKYSASNEEIFKNVKLKLFGSFNAKGYFSKVIRKSIHFIKFYSYLFFKVPRKSTVIVYHSLDMSGKVKFLKLFKKSFVVLELNEIYGDVIKKQEIVKKEIKISKIADSYIFPSKILAQKINIYKKPFSINYGTYNISILNSEPFNDGLIHCVYAGTFSKEKGGVENAIKSFEYLDSNYHLHILGFGSKTDIQYTVTLIENMQKKTKSKITYHGTLHGREFEEFLSKCHVGLSTQSSNNSFNESSFPSKILMYLSCGLNVVSVKLKTITDSVFKDYVTTYDYDNPELIAKAIKEASKKIDKHFNRELLVELDTSFSKDLRNVLHKK